MTPIPESGDLLWVTLEAGQEAPAGWTKEGERAWRIADGTEPAATPTPEREEALWLARAAPTAVYKLADGTRLGSDRTLLRTDFDTVCAALLALAADLEAAEQRRMGGGDDYRLRMLSEARERMHAAEDRAEAAERERDAFREEAEEQQGRWLLARDDLATAREALEDIADEETDTSEARRIARAALRSLGEKA